MSVEKPHWSKKGINTETAEEETSLEEKHDGNLKHCQANASLESALPKYNSNSNKGVKF